MKHLRHLIAIVSLLAVPVVKADDKPAAKAEATAAKAPDATPPVLENEDIVKNFIVQGTLKQIIGSFSTYGHPRVGDSFEIDLSNLPRRNIKFARPQTEPASEVTHSAPYIPFSAPLNIESVNLRMKGDGASKIFLSSRSETSMLRIQIWAASAEAFGEGSKIRIIIAEEHFGTILGVAEVEGLLKAHPLVPTR
jgi:hypothetical protein